MVRYHYLIISGSWFNVNKGPKRMKSLRRIKKVLKNGKYWGDVFEY